MSPTSRAPSMTRLTRAFPQATPATLRMIRKIIQGDYTQSNVPADILASMPNDHSPLSLIDALLTHHGVEPIRDRDGHVIADYSNAGETYSATILQVTATNTFRLTTIGDFVETWERSHPKLP